MVLLSVQGIPQNTCVEIYSKISAQVQLGYKYHPVVSGNDRDERFFLLNYLGNEIDPPCL